MNATDPTLTTIRPSTAPSPSTPGRRRGRRRLTGWIVAGAGLALVALILGLAGVGPFGGPAGDRGTSIDILAGDEDGFFGGEELGGGPGTDEIAIDGGDEGLGGGVDLDGGSTEPAPVDPEVEPEVEPDGGQPEPPINPIPATLVVMPDPVHLKPGVYTGIIKVANGGDQFMDWTATTKPWVSLSDTHGQLGARAENVVSFTVDASDLPAGSFSFKIKVTGNGGTEYVDVVGAKPVDQITS